MLACLWRWRFSPPAGRGSVLVLEAAAVGDLLLGGARSPRGEQAGRDFGFGYSPERINPGDKNHRFETITKIVSGNEPKTSDIIADVYGSVVTAGIHRAPSI